MNDIFLSLADTEKDTFQIVAGWIGNALALFFFFSPVLLMYRLIKEIIDYKVVPYISLIANIMNCLLWFIYGYKKDDIQIWLCNGIGGTTSLIYLLIFWFYFVEKSPVIYLGLVALTIALMGGIFSIFMYIIEGFEICGYFAMAFNIIMYAAPGQRIFEVLKTGNYILIPILSSSIGFLCSLSWFIYGLYDSTNWKIIIPNGLGIIFSIIQIVCWIYYFNKSKQNPSATQQPFVTVGSESK